MAAYRRAARLCDGFTFIDLDTAELAERVGIMRGLLAECGREKEPFEIYAGVTDARSLDDYKRIEDLGVDAVFLGYRNAYEPDTMTLQQKLDAVKQLGDNVIAKY